MPPPISLSHLCIRQHPGDPAQVVDFAAIFKITVANFLHALRARLRERHTLRAHAWQSLANYAQQGFGLIFGIIMAHILTPADFGAFGFAAASVFLALLPAMWSLAPTLAARGGQTPENYQSAAGFGWCVVFLRLAIVATVCAVFFQRGQHQTAGLCLLMGIAESGRELNNVQRVYLEGQGNFKPNLLSATMGIAFCLGVAVPVSFLGWGPFALALPAVGCLLIDFFIYRHFSGRNIFVKPTWSLRTGFRIESFWLWLHATAEVTLMRLDSWFVGKFLGEQTLGYYNRAFGYAPISHMLLSSFVANPTVVGLARCETIVARRRLLLRTAAVILAGGFLNWVVFFLFARPIVLFVFGAKWESAVPLFQAYASLSLAYAFGFLPTTLMLSACRYREIGIIRISCVALFAIALIFTPGTRSAISVAWLVQATWVLQGLLLLFRGRSLFMGIENAPEPVI